MRLPKVLKRVYRIVEIADTALGLWERIPRLFRWGILALLAASVSSVPAALAVALEIVEQNWRGFAFVALPVIVGEIVLAVWWVRRQGSTRGVGKGNSKGVRASVYAGYVDVGEVRAGAGHKVEAKVGDYTSHPVTTNDDGYYRGLEVKPPNVDYIGRHTKFYVDGEEVSKTEPYMGGGHGPNLWNLQLSSQDVEATHTLIPSLSVIPHVEARELGRVTEYLIWASLHVTNTGQTTLRDVEVRVSSCLWVVERHNEPGKYILLDPIGGWSPSDVYWSRLEADPPQLRLDIPPGPGRNAIIAFSDNSNGPPGILNGSRSPAIA